MTKLITPAMASEPYWADAPSRRTSTRFNAMPIRGKMSTAWAPLLMPETNSPMTAPRCRRLPLTKTKVLSAGKPRRFTGLIKVAASLMGSRPTL